MTKKGRAKGVIPKADRINVLRIRSGLTWCELAEAAGVSGKVRSKLSAGHPVSVRSLRAVAKILGVEFAEIVVLPDGDQQVSRREAVTAGAA